MFSNACGMLFLQMQMTVGWSLPKFKQTHRLQWKADLPKNKVKGWRKHFCRYSSARSCCICPWDERHCTHFPSKIMRGCVNASAGKEHPGRIWNHNFWLRIRILAGAVPAKAMPQGSCYHSHPLSGDCWAPPAISLLHHPTASAPSAKQPASIKHVLMSQSEQDREGDVSKKGRKSSKHDRASEKNEWAEQEPFHNMLQHGRNSVGMAVYIWTYIYTYMCITYV